MGAAERVAQAAENLASRLLRQSQTPTVETPVERPEGQIPVGDYEQISSQATDISSFDWSIVSPEESGIPPESQGSVYLDMAYDMDIQTDPYAMDLLYAGWFDEDTDTDQRVDARAAFFQYMGWDEWQFDWDDWREWYEATYG